MTTGASARVAAGSSAAVRRVSGAGRVAVERGREPVRRPDLEERDLRPRSRAA